MPIQHCPYPGCEYATEDVKDELAAILLKIHFDGSHSTPQGKPAKPPSVKQPEIKGGGTSEEWQYFLTRWTEYKVATKVSGVDLIIQLLDCCSDTLRKEVNSAAGRSLIYDQEQDVLKRIEALAVRQENIMVARVELHDMHQDIEEGIRSFNSRVKGQANVCHYIIDCPSCSCHVNYTEEIIKDVIVKGISDSEIQLDILSNSNQKMSLEDILSYVEAKEAGKRSASKLMSSIQNACSSRSTYKKTQRAR